MKKGLVKTYRDDKKKTQEELAREMNVSQQCIARWESGETSPRADKIPKLAKILGCSIDELFEE